MVEDWASVLLKNGYRVPFGNPSLKSGCRILLYITEPLLFSTTKLNLVQIFEYMFIGSFVGSQIPLFCISDDIYLAFKTRVDPSLVRFVACTQLSSNSHLISL